LTSDW